MRTKMYYIQTALTDLKEEILNFTFDEEYDVKEFFDNIEEAVEQIYKIDLYMYEAIADVLEDCEKGVYNSPDNEQFYKNILIRDLSILVDRFMEGQ